MGYSTRPGTSIRDFQPDNDADTLYIQADYKELPLSEILDRARAHFGADVSLEDLTIGAEHIHTQCLGYDRYDSGDYEEFIVLRRAKSA